MFYANSSGGAGVPYEPIHLEVNKAEYQLTRYRPIFAMDKEIGLGANGSTPEGEFRVVDRVQHPNGENKSELW